MFLNGLKVPVLLGLLRFGFKLWELDVGGSNPSAPTNLRPFRTPFLLKNTNENGVFCI